MPYNSWETDLFAAPQPPVLFGQCVSSSPSYFSGIDSQLLFDLSQEAVLVRRTSVRGNVCAYYREVVVPDQGKRVTTRQLSDSHREFVKVIEGSLKLQVSPPLKLGWRE